MTVAAAPVAAAPAAGAPNGAAPAPVPGSTGTSGTTTPETPAAKVAEAYRFKKTLKVNGREHQVDLDEAGLTRELQVGRHTQAQLAAAQAQLEQQRAFDNLISQGDYEAAFKMKGLDIEQAIATRAQRNAQLAEMTPEQQEIAQLREQLAQTNQRTEREAAQRKQQAEQARQQQARESIKSELFEALDLGGFKLGPNVSKQVRGAALAAAARAQKAAMLAKQPRLTPEQLVGAVHRHFLAEQTRLTSALSESADFRGKYGKEIGSHFEALTGGLEGEALLSFVGPKFLQRMVAAQMAQLSGASAQGGVPLTPNDATPPPPPRPPGTPPKALDYFEMEADMRRRRGVA